MDKYILRLANSNNAPGVRNTATFQKFSIDLPNSLKVFILYAQACPI